MQLSDIPQLSEERTTLAGIPRRANFVLAAAGVGVLIVAFVLGWFRRDSLSYFLHAYLVGFCFYLSISLGALFFVALQHACRAGWSVTVRRVAEVLSANTLLMALLFLPILASMIFGNTALYEWMDPEIVVGDEVLEGKRAYLNFPFFAVRAVLFFLVWGGLSWFFWRRSLLQDRSGDAGLTLRMERVSYPALVLFGVTITFASFDWLMSLTPHWFSTMYGVYYFAGAIVGFFAVAILTMITLQTSGRLVSTVTVDHYHELGKLLFGFVVFWGYIAFSQYMLIWYANIPEETVWYLPRQQGPWVTVSVVLLFGHLLLPFFGLLSRRVKRSKALLGFWAGWLLVLHWLDVHYLVMPQVDTVRLPLGVIDICCTIGLGLVYLAGILTLAGDRPLIPVRDPRLGEALGFANS